MSDAWDLQQYERFRAERFKPFLDVLALVERHPGLRAVDLGCGSGEGTALMHQSLGCTRTLGLDASPAMLAGARSRGDGDALSFVEGQIEDTDAWCGPDDDVDLIISNAALHWVADHVRLMTTLIGCLSPRGQLAVQMPVNDDHPSHQVARELCRLAPYAKHLGDAAERPVLPPEQYSRLLHRLGLARQRVYVEVYVHELDGVAGVIEWVKGSVLTVPRERLPPALYVRFESDYRERLMARFVDESPFVYTFKRLFLWGAKGPPPGAAASF